MDERFFAQLVAELRESHREALALLTQALAMQLDARRLEGDLLGLLRAAELAGPVPGLLRPFVESCAAAAAGEALARVQPPGEAGRPS